jgi:hypothetical protein
VRLPAVAALALAGGSRDALHLYSGGAWVAELPQQVTGPCQQCRWDQASWEACFRSGRVACPGAGGAEPWPGSVAAVGAVGAEEGRYRPGIVLPGCGQVLEADAEDRLRV